MTFGTFTLIKNEIRFIDAHIKAWLPYVDEMVFFDGDSTDGTLEVIRRHAEKSPKIKLFEGKDPKNLEDDYVRLSNECMWALSTDLAMFLHPDMFPVNGEAIRALPDDIIAGAVHMKSFAGDPEGKIYEIKGRGTAWKNIYRLRNPDLGAHYFGHYGAQNEDTYYSEITGDQHYHFGSRFDAYPYPVYDTGLIVKHFSDVRPYERRLGRMVKCMVNQGYPKDMAEKLAPAHPRVSLKSGAGFEFIESGEVI